MALFVRSFLCFRKFIAFGGQHVVHMHRFLVENRASCGPVTVDQPHGRIYWYRAVMRPDLKLVTILEAHHGVIGIAEFAGTFGNGLENRLDVGGRRGDHPQNVAAAGLVSQRSERSRVFAWTSSNSLTFSIAIAAWSAKVVASSICLSVNERASERVKAITPIGTPSRSIGTASIVRKPPNRCASVKV